MTLNVNPYMAATVPPPVMEARRWIAGKSFSSERPLINVSQAAPVDPPPPQLRQAMADAVLEDDSAHLYGPVLGLDELRRELALECTIVYGAPVVANQVAITSGCNQAFSAVISTLCAPGDEVIIPTPWYFNHKMWLDMNAIKTVPLATGHDLLPSAEQAAGLITSKTRAIVLVSPNNPGGVEYPSSVVNQFYELCKDREITLIVDETYRNFDSREGAPHELFTDRAWPNTFIQLYSFSKAYRLTGHRVGSIVASEERLSQVEKFLDTVAICPSQVGQRAALWGLQNLGDWLAEQRLEILARRQAIESNFPRLEAKGWGLRGCGAYFAYMTHPLEENSASLAPRMVDDIGVLCLPGTMFMPETNSGGQDALRIAFANLDVRGITQLFDRLETL